PVPAAMGDTTPVTMQNMRDLMAEFMGTIQTRVAEEVTKQIAPISETINKQNAELVDKMNEQRQTIRELDQRMRACENSDGRSTAASSRTVSSDGSKARRLGDASSAGGPTPPSDARKVWIGTWPRPVLDKIRRAHFEQIKQNFPITQHAEGEFHRVSQSYSIIFPTTEKAKEFRLQIAATTMTWVDPRNGRQFPLRARGDLPADARDMQRKLSKLYTPMREFALKSTKWSDACRLGVNGFKGSLFITNGDDIWALITANQISYDKYHFVPVGDELADWGISIQQANELSLDPPTAILEVKSLMHAAAREMAELLAEYWGKIFSNSQHPDAHASPLLECLSPVHSNGGQFVSSTHTYHNWILSKGEFVDMAQRKKDSAPGPDGIRYSGWKAIGSLGYDLLYNLYDSGATLFDFKQAFPSVFHDWIAAVLDKLGIPTCIRFAIHSLYDQNWTMVPFPGASACGFWVSRGMKQGCPMSGVLFATILHPVLVKVKRFQQSYEFILPCFADGIALVARNLLAVLPLVVRELVTSGQWAGLVLNLGKCHIMMLHVNDRKSPVQMFRDNTPRMNVNKFSFGSSGLYLGAIVGPDGHLKSWYAPAQKLFDRCTCIKGLKLGLNLSLSAYNTFALPVLSHVAQCYEPSKLVHVEAREGLQRLTNAPRYAFSPLALHHMKKIGLECEAQEVRVAAPAALLRAATRSDAFWRMKDWLAEIKEDDDQCIARVISFPSSNSIV
ncbi:unnamed protein product, partial [Prorocentrum cordatum]